MTTLTKNHPAKLRSFGMTQFTDKPVKSPVHTCTTSPCGAHHWLIDTNVSKTSKVKCKWCGRVREFINWFDVQIKFSEGGYEQGGRAVREY